MSPATVFLAAPKNLDGFRCQRHSVLLAALRIRNHPANVFQRKIGPPAHRKHVAASRRGPQCQIGKVDEVPVQRLGQRGPEPLQLGRLSKARAGVLFVELDVPRGILAAMVQFLDGEVEQRAQLLDDEATRRAVAGRADLPVQLLDVLVADLVQLASPEVPEVAVQLLTEALLGRLGILGVPAQALNSDIILGPSSSVRPLRCT